MYDMHYDLLTIIYFMLKQNSKFYNPQKLFQICKEIYNNNVLGGIINLYFMSEEEMLQELDISREELMDVKTMFQQSINYLEWLKPNQVIPRDIDFIYSIEGCDYLNVEDLEFLYNLGLRAILPVWNEKNKYGSGNRSKDGLTELGKELINKAVELGIIIDISHANEKTFDDILEQIEKLKPTYQDLIVACTHSNIRTLCNRDRNLKDEQLIKLRDIGGYIGLFTNGNFLSSNNKNLTYEERANEFMKHLNYLLYQIKFPLDKIIVSTDDMNFNPDTSYHHLESFPIATISNDLYTKILNTFGEEVAQAILIDNPKRIIAQVKQTKKTAKKHRLIHN